LSTGSSEWKQQAAQLAPIPADKKHHLQQAQQEAACFKQGDRARGARPAIVLHRKEFGNYCLNIMSIPVR